MTVKGHGPFLRVAAARLIRHVSGRRPPSEQPKRRFSTEKTQAHYIWLEIKD
ncbi:hypothetical protein [Sporolactobacillus terrae]|uniref:hypothetical protein n=1 Tax=Sporolactobacillus terrae TaxID=269673 RepID=UPI00159BB4E7|nr:hypothetical protein [Sporolactobacillus terrae]